jgi:uncharacterized membrane protein YoaK (UPF0700 family)
MSACNWLSDGDMRLSLPILLSFNAGYVDTAGFLALQGLFTAHVTGNFVTFGAAVVYGTSGVIAKLLALPTFCVVVMVARLLQFGLRRHGLPELRTMLALKFLLLVVATTLAIMLGPFPDSDSRWALATGMTLVAAMAIQNAVHRTHLPDAPPTTLMTGSSTQIMLDVADLIRGLPMDRRNQVRARLGKLSSAVLAFALGCGLAAGGYVVWGMWCFAGPPVLAAMLLFAHGAYPTSTTGDRLP